jgi:NADH:ubiquinone oxidoreductase subunit E
MSFSIQEDAGQKKKAVGGERETVIHVCHGPMCGRHAKHIMERLAQVQAKGVPVRAEKCPCMGMCENAPNIRIKESIHGKMNPIKASDLAKRLR